MTDGHSHKPKESTITSVQKHKMQTLSVNSKQDVIPGIQNFANNDVFVAWKSRLCTGCWMAWIRQRISTFNSTFEPH